MRFKKWDICPICHTTEFDVKDDIGKCHKCGHGFRINTAEKPLPHYFEKEYWDRDKNRQGIMSVEPGQQWNKWVTARLKLLESFNLISHAEPGKIRVLEFGCAEGMLLYALKQKGYRVMGNDVNPISKESSKILNIEISNLPIEEFSQINRGGEQSKFDLIMSFHVMEHLHDPLTVAAHLSSMLSPNGVFLLHVPVDDQELSNKDHFHFFSNDSCLHLMRQFTKNIRSDFVYYPIRPGSAATAATYVGENKS